MTNATIYSDFDEAQWHEIESPIYDGSDDSTFFDIDAIARKLIKRDGQGGFYVDASHDEFWSVAYDNLIDDEV
ncbi:hypothetical protein NCPPB3778_71 [Rathayibacter phage NCPPB3778]|nr:hypothetical protein NCPPB3778_71 [Rathayibacter phage NCPPB3778]